MTKNIQDMTPVEIDTILAPMWEKQAVVAMQIAKYKRNESEIYATIEKIKGGARLVQYRTALDGIELMEKLALIGRYIVAEGDKLAKLELESLPYEAEYTRRGRWNRVYLADSYDGHAHNGTECITCHHGEERTQFAWLVQYSGQSEEEIVADAGERACTTCYKSAPANVLKRKTKMFSPKEIEAQKAREEREAARAQRNAKTASKAITAPDGSPLKGKWDVIKTERAAQIEAVDAIKDSLKLWESMVLEPLFEAHPGLEAADMFSRIDTRQQSEAYELSVRLVTAIAAKQGRNDKVVFEELKAKAEAKVKREKNEILKNVYRLMAGMEGYQAYAKAAEAQGLEPWNPHK
jgi:hypothetical protein